MKLLNAGLSAFVFATASAATAYAVTPPVPVWAPPLLAFISGIYAHEWVTLWFERLHTLERTKLWAALYAGLSYDLDRDEWDCVKCGESWADCEPIKMAAQVSKHHCKGKK